jgi:peptidoglycan/xylan/chitin deacetylase (PgdA/CDA1 family)
LLILCLPTFADSRTVAITVDDLPAATDRINDAMLAALVRHGVRATGFVIESKVQQVGADSSRRMLERWIARGHDLGNHTFSHRDLTNVTPEQFFDEVIRGEASFRPMRKSREGNPLFLRFPYNHAGDTVAKRDAVRAWLIARGYTVAVCTIENTDYEFARAYDAMLTRHDDAAGQRLRADYLAHTAAIIDYYTELHRQVFGRETAHVMLLHANRLNADVINSVLALFEQRNYRFVTLAEAQTDPAYATPEGPPTRFGPMWGYRWARAKEVKVDGRQEPEPPAWVRAYGN